MISFSSCYKLFLIRIFFPYICCVSIYNDSVSVAYLWLGSFCRTPVASPPWRQSHLLPASRQPPWRHGAGAVDWLGERGLGASAVAVGGGRRCDGRSRAGGRDFSQGFVSVFHRLGLSSRCGKQLGERRLHDRARRWLLRDFGVFHRCRRYRCRERRRLVRDGLQCQSLWAGCYRSRQ